MRVFIIDTSNMAPELQAGLIAVEGSSQPTAAEKSECIETVSTYVIDGWAIAADPHTPIGWLAALTAESACVPFVNLARLSIDGSALRQRTPEPSSFGAPLTGMRLPSSGVTFAE